MSDFRVVLPDAITLTLANLAARAAHLLLFLYVGNRFGASTDTDSVFFLYAPLSVIVAVASSVADVVVMPAMHRALKTGCARSLQKSIQRRALVAMLPTTILVLFAASQLTSTSAKLAVVLLLLPIPTLAAQSSIYMGVLNFERRYVPAVLSPLYGALATGPFLLALPSNSTSLAFSLLIFEAARVVGLRLHCGISRDTSVQSAADLRDMLLWAYRGAVWQVVGAFLMALNPLIGVMFARSLGTGAISTLEYANRLWNVVPLLFTGYLTIMYAQMSQQAALGNLDARHIGLTAWRVGVMASLCGLIFTALSRPLIDIAYGHGVMTTESLHTLAVLLSYFFLAVGPFMAGQVYVRALSADGRVYILARSALVNVCCNLVVIMILINPMGLNAIPLAVTAGYCAGLAVLIHGYRK